MTQKWKFTGESAADVPALGLTVEPGQTVEVDDPDVSAGLKGQSQWEHIPAKSKPAESTTEKKG